MGLTGVALTFVAAKGHLPGIGNDAASYVAIADRLAARWRLGYFLEPKLALWPPGWPATLAVGRWTLDLNPATTALWINAFLLVPLAFQIRWLLERNTSNERVIRAGVVVGVLGPATLSQSYMVQTEISFIVLVLAAFIALIRFSDTRRWTWFAVSVAAQWLGFMDRYVGLVAIGAGALWLVFERGSVQRGARFRTAVVYFVAACAVPGAWLLRNVAVTDTPFGPRDTPIQTYKSNAVDALTSLGQFLHGYARYQPFEGILRLASIGLAGLVGLFALVLLRRAISARNARPDAWRRDGTSWGDVLGQPVGLLVIYGIAHWIYMIYSASTIAFDPVNTRYLAPMFIPLMIAGLVLLDRGAFAQLTPAGTGGDRITKLASVALSIFVLLQVIVGVVRVSASYWTDEAQGYNSPRALDIRRSDVLDTIPPGCPLWSNFPELTYLTGIEARRSPRKTKFASTDVLNEIEVLTETTAAGTRTCLIWVSDDRYETPQYQWQLAELQQRFEMEVLGQDPNVAVFRILSVR